MIPRYCSSSNSNSGTGRCLLYAMSIGLHQYIARTIYTGAITPDSTNHQVGPATDRYGQQGNQETDLSWGLLHLFFSDGHSELLSSLYIPTTGGEV